MDNISPDAQVLPWAISNSIVRVYEDKFFSNLLYSTKQVLAALIRFGLNLENVNQYIFIKKSTISELLNVMEATVYRALSKLEEEKLIEREPQKRTSSNFKVIGRIKITSMALKAIGIEGYLEQNKAYLDQRKTRLAPMQDKNNLPTQSLKRQSEQSSFKEIQGRRVPMDLAWLVEKNELKISGLLQLMKKAREAGKRLSDIVAVCIHTLREITGRPLYGYLLKLISTDSDFTFVERWEEEEKIEKQRAIEAKAEAKRQIEIAQTSLRGKKFRLESGQFVEFTEAAIEFTDVTGRHAGMCHYEQGASFIEQALLGSLESVDKIPQSAAHFEKDKKTDSRSAEELSPRESPRSAFKAVLENWKVSLGLKSANGNETPLDSDFNEVSQGDTSFDQFKKIDNGCATQSHYQEKA
jgi:hypothetical protein